MPSHPGEKTLTATQYTPGTLHNVLPQHHQQPMAPLQSPGYPMHNNPYQQYPYTVGQPQNIPSFIHPQTPTNPPLCAPGLPMSPYPAQYMPDQNHQMFVPQMAPNGAMLNMMSGMVPSMHPGIPPPMTPMSAPPNNETAESNAPLDMSISNKPRYVLVSAFMVAHINH